MSGSLDRVTGDASRPGATGVPLGAFSAPGSGGLGRNLLVLLRNALGAPAVIRVDAPETTFRFNLGPADLDWFVLVPVSSAP